MFAIIKKQHKHSFKSITVQANTYGDVRYYVFNLRNVKRVNWVRLAERLGDLKTRVILAQDIPEPTNTAIRQSSCERYTHKLTANSLDAILNANHAYTSTQQATLIDLQCRHQCYADVLVNHFARVRIVTMKPEFYQNYSDAKLYECGAAITIQSTTRTQSDDTVLYVTPTGIVLPQMESSTAPIISAHDVGHRLVAPIYHSFYEQTSLPETLVSEDIAEDPALMRRLLGALYEFCGLRTLGTTPVGGFCDGTELTLEQIKVNIFALTNVAG